MKIKKKKEKVSKPFAADNFFRKMRTGWEYPAFDEKAPVGKTGPIVARLEKGWIPH